MKTHLLTNNQLLIEIAERAQEHFFTRREDPAYDQLIMACHDAWERGLQVSGLMPWLPSYL
jgi:hypothetical protein